MAVQFGAMIREYRQTKGWTQAQLAKALGYDSPQFVSLLEREQSKVPNQTLGQLIILLGIPEHVVIESLVKDFESSLVEDIDLGKKRAGKSR